MILMGFKQNWAKDLPGTEAYFNVIHHGFDLHMALGILRLPKGCDYSSVIGEEQQITVEVPDETPEPVEAPAEPQKKEKRTRKVSTAVYHGTDGKPLAKNLVNEITVFQVCGMRKSACQGCPTNFDLLSAQKSQGWRD